jgi:hypothetical protein
MFAGIILHNRSRESQGKELLFKRTNNWILSIWHYLSKKVLSRQYLPRQDFNVHAIKLYIYVIAYYIL